MPATLIQEAFDGGVVTKRHPTLLRPGELQQADDCVYRLFDPAIHRVGGRTEFNSTGLSASPIKGLAHLSFDTGTDVLLAYHTTKLYAAPFTALTGTFTAMLDDVPALPDAGTETMVPVPFSNRYHLLIADAHPRRIGYVNPSGGDVANCTLSTGTTLTTTNDGFKNAVVGQAISGSGGGGSIAANTRVASKTSSNVIVLDTAGTNGGPFTATLSSTPFMQQQVAGLLPTKESVTAAVVAGSWSSILGAGFYWFIYTEMVMPGAVDEDATGFLESGFAGDMVAAQIANTTTDAIQITRPTGIVNTVANGTNAATHWQVYMSKGTDAVTKPSLATFTRIGAPLDITTTSFTFKDQQLTQGFFFPTANQFIAGLTGLTTPNGAHTAYDGSFAFAPAGNESGTAYKTFGFLSSAPYNVTVVGVEVKVYVRTVASYTAAVILATSTKRSTRKTIGPSSNRVVTLGGPMDTWGVSWANTDFVDGTFICELRLGSTVLIPDSIDAVSVKVYYTGTSVNSNGRAFRTVTYRDQVGTTVSDTASFTLYRPTTGDVFNGALVINDPSDPALIRYSLPGIATAFPKPYFLRFHLADRKDIVTLIRRVGQVLIVGMRDHIQRVNYLPTEVDTDPQQGLAHEDLVVDHGIPGPLAGVVVDMGDGPVLVYVSQKGLHITDGIRSRFLNIDLDWPATVDVSKLDKCILRVHTKENWIVLYYVPPGASHSTPTRAMIFSYAPEKMKSGMTPAIGPFKVAARSACAATLNGVAYMLSAHNSLGKVYVEDQGLSVPASYTVLNAAGAETAITIVPTIKTRRIYPSGIGRQAREQRVYLMTTPFGATVTASSSTQTTPSVDLTKLTSSAAFGAVTVGMLVTGPNIQADTVVIAKTDSSNITISRAALAAFVTVTLTFDSGVFSIMVRGQDIGFAAADLELVYDTTTVGGLVVLHPDNFKESFELVFTKVALPAGTAAAFDVNMRLHYFAYLQSDAGQETNVATGG